MSKTAEEFSEVGFKGGSLDFSLYWYGSKVGSFKLSETDLTWSGFSDPIYALPMNPT